MPAARAEYEQLLKKADILVPQKRNYYIETNYSQYAHAHHAEDLDAVRQILEQMPEKKYVSAFERIMKRTDGHRFNMLVMRRDILDSYCSWLFGILFTLEKRLDISAYDSYNMRVFGFVAERLLDVWLDAEGMAYLEVPYLQTEPVNWPKKIFAFLKRKFIRQR